MKHLKHQFDTLIQSIRSAEIVAARPRDSVQLLAVSKTWPAEALRTVASYGQKAFGENYLQEALSKISALNDLDLEWHFIGPIQSNKTRDIAQHFAWVHSVDRDKIARRLNEHRNASSPLNVCIQLNIDNEASKSGIQPDALWSLAEHIASLDNLRLRGLMIIPARKHNPTEQGDSFQRAYTLYQALQQQYPQVDTLSMGMSGDMMAAIQHGSTLVRVGTALFGQRQQ